MTKQTDKLEGCSWWDTLQSNSQDPGWILGGLILDQALVDPLFKYSEPLGLLFDTYLGWEFLQA